MTTAIKRRRGTTTQHSTFTGLDGELTIDTTKETVVVHDGATAGGFPLLRQDLSNNTNVATLSGTQTFSGAKTFSSTISGSITGNAGTVTNGVYTSGDQTIGGVKTFSSPVTLPAASAAAPAITTSGDLNTGIFFPAADTIAFAEGGVESMRIDSAGNLGIGTSSPAYRLDVSGSIRGTGGTGALRLENASNTGVYARFVRPNKSYILALDINNNGGNDFTLFDETAGASRLTVDTSGNLGLGVTPSAWGSNARALEIGSGGSTSLAFNFSETNLSTNVYRINTGASLYKANGIAMMYAQSSGGHSWLTAPSGTAGNAISFTQAMTLTSGGNLSVGTTSSLAKLTVEHAIALGGGGASKPGGLMYGMYLLNGGGPVIHSEASIAFAAGGSERARIDSSGNLLVGTTSGGSGNESGRLRLVGNTGGINGFYHQQTVAGGYTLISNAISNGGIFYHANFLQAGTSVGFITSTGSTTTYATSSDYRLKNSIAPMTGALAKVALLKPVTYKWNADGSDGEGFIAHELAEVCPQAVTGEKDAVDAEGNPQYQGIDVSFLVGTLTAAIQELKAEFDAYKASHP